MNYFSKSKFSFTFHSLRQKQLRLNSRSDAPLFITIIKYIFVKGNAGIIFYFERPKPENTHWMNQPRDEHGDFIKKPK